MFVCERPSLLAATERLLPLARKDAEVTVQATEPDLLTCTVGTKTGGIRSTGLGRVLLPGAVRLPLAPLVRALRCGTGSCRTEVASNGSTAVVAIDPDGSGRKFSFALEPGEAPAEWPTPSPDRTSAELPSTALTDLIRRAAFAAPHRLLQRSAWELRGVLLGIDQGRVSCSSTDALLFVTGSVAAETIAKQRPRSILLPGSTLRAWAKASHEGESVRLTLSDDIAMFSVGVVSAWSRQLPGIFPPPAKLLATPPHSLTVPTERFATELAAALAVADPKAPVLTLSSKPGALTLTSATGRTRVSVNVPTADASAQRLDATIDGARLAKVVKRWDTEPRILIGYNSAHAPLMLSAGDYRAALAPHRERDE